MEPKTKQWKKRRTKKKKRTCSEAGMLTRPAGHEAKTEAEAEARKSEAEDEAEAQKLLPLVKYLMLCVMYLPFVLACMLLLYSMLL